MTRTRKRLIDFRKIKERVSIEDVASHYELSLNAEGDSLKGGCPLCGGEEDSRRFSITPKIGAWKCFSCGEGGNMLDLVAKMEGVSLRDAAIAVAEWFEITDCYVENAKPQREKKQQETKNAARAKRKKRSRKTEPMEPPAVGVNEPLDWPGLKNLDAKHEWLSERGYHAEALEHFGVGYCAKGIMKGCIAFPIHNLRGELLGYAGWPVKNEKAEYHFPKGFNRSLELFNIHRAIASDEYRTSKTLILVFDFFRVIDLFEAGYGNVVALTDMALSAEQEKILRVVDPPMSAAMVFVAEDEEEAAREVTATIASFAWTRLTKSQLLLR